MVPQQVRTVHILPSTPNAVGAAGIADGATSLPQKPSPQDGVDSGEACSSVAACHTSPSRRVIDAGNTGAASGSASPKAIIQSAVASAAERATNHCHPRVSSRTAETETRSKSRGLNLTDHPNERKRRRSLHEPESKTACKNSGSDDIYADESTRHASSNRGSSRRQSSPAAREPRWKDDGFEASNHRRPSSRGSQDTSSHHHHYHNHHHRHQSTSSHSHRSHKASTPSSPVGSPPSKSAKTSAAESSRVRSPSETHGKRRKESNAHYRRSRTPSAGRKGGRRSSRRSAVPSKENHALENVTNRLSSPVATSTATLPQQQRHRGRKRTAAAPTPSDTFLPPPTVSPRRLSGNHGQEKNNGQDDVNHREDDDDHDNDDNAANGDGVSGNQRTGRRQQKLSQRRSSHARESHDTTQKRRYGDRSTERISVSKNSQPASTTVSSSFSSHKREYQKGISGTLSHRTSSPSGSRSKRRSRSISNAKQKRRSDESASHSDDGHPHDIRESAASDQQRSRRRDPLPAVRRRQPSPSLQRSSRPLSECSTAEPLGGRGGTGGRSRQPRQLSPKDSGRNRFSGNASLHAQQQQQQQQQQQHYYPHHHYQNPERLAATTAEQREANRSARGAAFPAHSASASGPTAGISEFGGRLRGFCSKPPGPVEGPPSPLHPPTSYSQLRLFLLVGLVSGETLPPLVANTAATARSNARPLPRLTFICPIHSAMMAKRLRDYFLFYCDARKDMLHWCRGDVIATELRLLRRGLSDPFLGPIEPFIELEHVSKDAVIVHSFDFLRADRLVRAGLRPDHPCQATVLWDPAAFRPSGSCRRRTCHTGDPLLKSFQDLEGLDTGAGFGVEMRALHLADRILEQEDKQEQEKNESVKEKRNSAAFCSNANKNCPTVVKDGLPVPDHFDEQECNFSQGGGLPHEEDTVMLLNNRTVPHPSGGRPGGLPGNALLSPYGQRGRPPLDTEVFEAFTEKLGRGNNTNFATMDPLTATGGTSGLLPQPPPPPPGPNAALLPFPGSLRPPAESGSANVAVARKNDTTTSKDSATLAIEALLDAPSAKEKQLRDSGAELRQLLTVPTAKHSMTTRSFQNRGGSKVQQICPSGTRHDCLEAAIAAYNNRKHPRLDDPPPRICGMVHFRRILYPHTDISLGDCSYLDTCRHMASCRFVHYEVDLDTGTAEQKSELLERMEATDRSSTLGHNIGAVFAGQLEERPAQWITCDVRIFDWSMFRGQVKVVMADPPWDIHMDLPYGTMTDAEMRSLRLDQVQDEGCLFLWVTGRAMELGRECMKLWGYKQIEEIVWVKTNQLHRIIRTGRTGHWLNHSKEHCLVGVKGNPKLNRHLDTDIIVAEVRETSRKPDEIYRIIERLCPGAYKLELFGRPHNVRDNWITLGNQLDGIRLHDPHLIQSYNAFAAREGLPPAPASTLCSTSGEALGQSISECSRTSTGTTTSQVTEKSGRYVAPSKAASLTSIPTPASLTILSTPASVTPNPTSTIPHNSSFPHE